MSGMNATGTTRTAERLGATLAVFMRYGQPKVREAIAALRVGKATPAQQRVVAEFMDAALQGAA